MPDTVSAILSATPARLALFSDFDGTLVGIAPTPDAVRVPDDLPARLDNLHRALGGAFAVVTGRMLADIDAFLPGLSFPVIGSHGAERRHAGPPDSALFGDARLIATRLERLLGAEDGILIEHKPTGVAVHFRAAPLKENRVRAALAGVLAGFDRFAAVEGKKVIEARPRDAHKGGAVATLMQSAPFVGRVPVFVGDDLTDEDAFSTVAGMGGFGVKVGEGETVAPFRLPGIPEVYLYFDALIARAAGLDAPHQGSMMAR